jgi:drug/metabolite transporter (DMT)-like permease
MGSTVGKLSTPGHASTTTRPGVWLTELGLVLMALIWGVNYSIVKFGTTVIDPLAFNGARVALAALVLSVLVAVRREAWPARGDAWRLLALGVLGNGFYQYLFVEGIARTSATDAALVVAASPAFIAIIGRMRGIERASAGRVLGILLSLGGIAFVVLGSSEATQGVSSVTGDLLVLGGSLSWALYSVLLKPYTERVPGLQLSALTMVGGAAPLALVALPNLMHAGWRGMPGLGWGAMLYSGLLALVVAYLFWYRGVRVIGPTRSAIYSNLQPVIAVLFAWVMLSETPTLWQGVGTACIMASLLLTRA